MTGVYDEFTIPPRPGSGVRNKGMNYMRSASSTSLRPAEPVVRLEGLDFGGYPFVSNCSKGIIHRLQLEYGFAIVTFFPAADFLQCFRALAKPHCS